MPASTRPQSADLGIIGSTGLKRYSNRVYEELLPELSGSRGRLVIAEMVSQDPTTGAALFAVEMLMRQVDWRVNPADDTPEAAEIADFFQTVLDDMSQTWEETLSEIISFLPFGWAYFEIIYKLRQGDQTDPSRRSRFKDGRVGWRKLAIRSQDTLYHWEFDPEGGVQGLWQIAPPTFIPAYIPIDKALLFRTKSRKQNPEGVSVLRTAYRPWYMKKRIENIEAIGVERDLAGLPVMKVPPRLLDPTNTSVSDVALRGELLKLVQSIRRDEQEGILFPQSFDENGNPEFALELLSSSGSRQFDTNAIIARYKLDQLMQLMADFLAIGHEQTGSYSLVSNRTALFSVALGAYLDIVSGVVTEHGFTRLMRLNGFPSELRPSLAHGDIETTDLEQLGNYLKALAGAGMPVFPNPSAERWLLEQAHIPVPDLDSEEEATGSSEHSAPPAASPQAVEGDDLGNGEQLAGNPPKGTFPGAETPPTTPPPTAKPSPSPKP